MTKKIFKSIGLIALAIAVAIASFFVPMQKKGTSYLASADDSSQLGYIYNSSSLNFIMDDQNFSTNTRFNLNFKFSISTTSGGWNINVTDSLVGVVSSGSSIEGSRIFTEYDGASTSAFLPYAGLGLLRLYSSSNTAFYVNYTHSNVTDSTGTHYFNCNVQYITLYSGIGTATGTHSNYLSLYDNYGASLTFEFEIPEDYIYSAYSNRTYYTINALDITDNQIYQQGYNNGLSDNQENIYNNGYNTGFDAGFEDGKITGVVEANDYSFFSLFGAIFDAPVTMFTSLLNFNFLGINLWAFVTSLLTLSAILFVIKLFIRR